MTAPQDTALHTNVICVGVDSSAASDAAVAWAVEMAGRAASTIRLISVYGNDRQRTEEDAQRDLTRAAALIDGIETVCVLTHGEAAEGLLGESEDAAMLVLGRHGTAGLIRSALGSVGETCARLATCPVVIVPVPPVL